MENKDNLTNIRFVEVKDVGCLVITTVVCNGTPSVTSSFVPGVRVKDDASGKSLVKF